MKALLMITVLPLMVSLGVAQEVPDINSYLSMIETGQAAKVRELLPSLLSKYPNNPGIIYLQGLLTNDGAEAVRIYQSIVDNFAKSEWADDALYKVYQFYYSIGLYRTAELKLNQLKTDYPTSKYVVREAQIDTKDLVEEKEQPLQDPRRSLESRESKGDAVTSLSVQPAEEFTLQVGAYTSPVNAEKQKLFFEDLKYSVEVINKVKDARSLYIVLVGMFKSYEEAKAQGAEIKKAYNIDSIVVAR